MRRSPLRRGRTARHGASRGGPGDAALPPGLLVALGVVIALAAVLRLWHLSRTGMGGDESVYAGQAAVLSGADGFRDQFLLVSRGNSNFLLFQNVLSLVYRVIGVNELAARALAATCSILTVVVTYRVGVVLYGRAAAVIAAALLAISGYSIGLGRLALLDSTMALLFALTMLCVAHFGRTHQHRWLYLMAVCSALAIQAKVTAALALVVCAAYLAASGSLRRVTPRTALVAVLVFLLTMTPAVVQVADRWTTWRTFLVSSSHRASDVPWDYYASVLVSYEGWPLALLWATAFVVACVRWSRSDLLPVLWAVVVVGFFVVYPLKAFNYMLPAVPALALLAGHAGDDLATTLAAAVRRRRRVRLAPRPVTALALTALIGLVSAPSVANAVSSDTFGGLREAARWLRTNAPANAGVMTLSHGSAQYVFTFYAGQPAYPFGRFNLATVLPGGRVVAATEPAPGQTTPRDWVASWPRRLISSGAVSYLVFYTKQMDDPPEESSFSETSTQRVFRRLIARYGGRLVHTVFRNHEGRVWTYRLTRAGPVTFVRPSIKEHRVTVRASGLARTAAVTATYHRKTVATGRTRPDGTVELTFPLPWSVQARYLLTVTDERGNYASAHLPQPLLRVTRQGRRLRLRASGFAPDAPVLITYRRRPIAGARSDGSGRLVTTARLPGERSPRWFLTARDGEGNTVSTHLAGPGVRVRLRGRSVAVRAEGFRPFAGLLVLHHGRVLRSVRADGAGRLRTRVGVPHGAGRAWVLKVRDRRGTGSVAVVGGKGRT